MGEKLPRSNAFANGTGGKFTFTNYGNESAEGKVTLNGESLDVQVTSLGIIHYYDEYMVAFILPGKQV